MIISDSGLLFGATLYIAALRLTRSN